MKMQISVVIPTYKNRGTLPGLLRSFEEQTCSRRLFEVIVVFDELNSKYFDSIDKQKFKYSIRLYRQKHGGRARARNLGIRKAKGKIIVFVDDDCQVDKDFIKEHLKSHKKQGIVVLGSRFIRNDKTLELDNHCKMMERTLSKGNNFSSPWLYFATGNVSLERRKLIKAGFFDENFKGWGYEDTELGYRLFLQGLRYVYNKKAKVIMFPRVRNLKNIKVQAEKNLRYFIGKYPQEAGIKYFPQLISGRYSVKEYDKMAKGETIKPKSRYHGSYLFKMAMEELRKNEIIK